MRGFHRRSTRRPARSSTTPSAASIRLRLLTLALLLLPACLLVVRQVGATSILDPGGPRAHTISNLTWGLMAVATFTVVLVMALFVIGAFRRRDRHGTANPGNQGIRTVAIGGAVIPGIILIGVLVATLIALVRLAEPSEASAATIDVVGHQWWWEVTYADQGAITANEIHIPVGEPVEIKLTSDNVIHSFWVPELADKLDLIPGKTNTLWLQADTAGEYRGQCAEFCGLAHAMMAFIVVAEPPDQYTAWLSHERENAAQSSDPLVTRGQEVYFSSACVYCHAIRGTDSQGRVGPDLTHLASREYLAAGTIPNTNGNLTGWILNPDAIKPGTLMPGIHLPAPDLQALIAYLESLE